MTRQKCEIQALDQLGVPSFRNVTKEMVVELCSNVRQMDPKVAIAAFEQIPHMAKTITEACGGAVETAKKAIESNSSTQKACHETTIKIISLAEVVASKPDASTEDCKEAMQMAERAAEREGRMAEETHKSNEMITRYIVMGTMAFTGAILAPIVSTKVRVPRVA